MTETAVAEADSSLSYDDSAVAKQLEDLTQRFVARLDHVTAMLERMELDERRLTPLHRRALTRELRLSARECHAALQQFTGWLGVSRSKQSQ